VNIMTDPVAGPDLGGSYLVVDDHPLMREAMASLVRDIAPAAAVAMAGSVAEALRLADGGVIRALIVDLNLPDGDGAVLVTELRRRSPELPILVLTACEDHAQVRRLIAAGATGFAPKSAGPATLSAALRLVLAGQTYVPPLMLALPDAEVDEMSEAATMAPTAGKLTPRQLEVLRLVCDGLSNKHISRRLGLAERTIKVHVGAIFRALGVSNRTQAAREARTQRLLD